MFATLTGIEANHVPYKGGGPSVMAVAQGEEPAYTTVDEFARLIREDYAQMGKMVKLAGLKAE